MAMNDESENILPDNDTFWKTLSKTGRGWFNYKLVVLCGLALSSDAIEVLSVSNILPSAACDLKLTGEKKGWVNASIFIGMTLGSLVWGCMADLVGRRITLVMSLATNALFNLGSSFAQSFEVFLFCRLMSGVGVGGSIPVLFTYNCEFHSKEFRGLLTSFVSSFWAVGGIMSSGLAWLIIPSEIDWSVNENFRFKSWQIYLSLCSLPVFLSAFFVYLMPESPKYLYENKTVEEAKAVLRLMFKQNNPKGDVDAFEDDLSDLDKCSDNHKKNLSNDESKRFRGKAAGCRQICFFIFKMKQYTIQMFKQWGNLFTKHQRYHTIIMLILYNSMAFGYYGMFMWFPELFKRMDMFNGSICATGNVTLNTNGSEMDICKTPSSAYYQSLIVTACGFPGNLIVILFVDKIGRKFLLSSSLFLSGISVFLIYALKSSFQGFVFSCIFGMLTSIFWNVTNLVITEIFPTNLRSTGAGLCLGVCRFSSILANVLMGYLLEVDCILPLVTIAALLCFASFVTCCIRETRNCDLN